MPTRRLSTMAMTPHSMNSSATTSSTQRVAMSPRALPGVDMYPPRLRLRCPEGAESAPRAGPFGANHRLLRGEEARFLHQPLVDVLGVLHPVRIFLARHERRVERRVLRVLLPLGQLAHLRENVDVVVDLFLRG